MYRVTVTVEQSFSTLVLILYTC